MIDPKILEDFGAKMSALLANSPARDIEKNAKAGRGFAVVADEVRKLSGETEIAVVKPW